MKQMIEDDKNIDLDHARNGVEHELAKITMVSQSNAIIYPNAMMIHSKNTFVAIFTMVCSWQLNVLAFETIRNLLNPFDDVANLSNNIFLTIILLLPRQFHY